MLRDLRFDNVIAGFLESVISKQTRKSGMQRISSQEAVESLQRSVKEKRQFQLRTTAVCLKQHIILNY